MQHLLPLKIRRAFIFFISLQISTCDSYGQQYENEPQREIAWGIKVVTRQIQYGKNNLYKTDPTSIGLHTGIRYDIPKKIGTKHYIDLVGQAGFLFCKAIVFDTTFRDPNSNAYIRQYSHNPTYLPIYFGIYNMSAISFGAEVFYWKGLGTRDMWGAKFLSLGYNGKHLRVNAAGEWYAQLNNVKNNGVIFSVDFFWKLINNNYKGK